MKELIVITPPGFYAGEDELLTRLFEEGMTRLHLRKPGCAPDRLADLLSRVPVAYHARIVLHDCPELAVERGLGVHLNGRNPVAPPGYTGAISRSCHSLEEVDAYKSACRYLFLSPIFPSISKQGYGKGFALDELRQAAALGRIDSRVIALGGISTRTLPHISQLPFGGYAVLGGLWGENPTLRQADLIIQHFKELQTWL